MHQRHFTKHSHEPRRCVFCGAGKISREHFWPVWAADLLPNGPELSHTVHASNRDNITGQLSQPATTYRRQGSVISRRIRTVCKDCNSGWMNRQEEAARPTLTALARGDTITLGETEQLTLARWVAMKVMTSESDQRGNAVTFPSERRSFKENLAIPAGFSMWVFRCGDPRWRAAYIRHATPAWRPSAPAPLDQTRNAIQQVTFGFGDLLVTCIVIRVPGYRMDLLIPEGSATQLWPPKQVEIGWPHPRVVNGHEARLIASNLNFLITGLTRDLRERGTR